jgi:hypothetical protein
MFRIKDGKVVDPSGRIVGIVKDGAFSQQGSDPYYRNGLRPIELEQVSEAMQRQK